MLLILMAGTSFIYAQLNRHRNDNISSLTSQNLGGGAISGRIVDSKGFPIVRERVYAVSEKYGDAQQPGSYGVGQSSVLTDNQGNYRIRGLAPGNYIVSIGPSPEGEVNSQTGKRAYYVKRYYPNTYSKDNAKVIEVNEGSEITEINITAGEMKNTVEISGRVVNADTGQPIAGVTISHSVVPRRRTTGVGTGAISLITTIASTYPSNTREKSNENGEFLITGVLPGKYYITSLRQQNQDTEYYAEPTECGVTDSGISDLVVKMRRGITISGKVDIQGTNDPEILSKVSEMRVNATSRPEQFEPFPSDGNRSATIRSDGTFTLKGLKPGKVSFGLNSTRQDGGVFQLDRIEYKGVSIGQEGIEVGAGENLNNVRLIAVYGTITVRGYVKIKGKLPEEIKLRLIASRQGDNFPSYKYTDIDAQGHFVITNLSAGVYSFRLLPLMPRTFGENSKSISDAINRAEQKVVVSETNQQPIVFTVDLN